ncbi:MAG: S41 family peptidase [Candidatus Kapabacteria bacterium]|jgi:carboxyl-terminal processing protease|nr:S41 family peptidase [Candidatus Kapabacteria bacterium]
MNRRIIFGASILVLGVTLGFLPVSDGSVYARIARSLETFGEVFRQVSMNYVDDVDPEVVIEAGINGMLSTLDPYTTYVRQDEMEDIDMLSTGVYTGFGISVALRDSLLTITNIRMNQPAAQAGLRIGDRLVSIDGVVVDTMSPKSLRAYTRGPVGSTAVLRFVREGRPDTMMRIVRRAAVDVEDVSYSELLPGGIGYIKLSRFSRRAAEEVREALTELRGTGQLRGLVLDVRDNPGGLLESAVGIVRLFVPKGSKIVATMGRDESESRTYTSETEPLEPDVPLSVLINERSASASEIVAGAIQDLDRGVIIGRRSFGKGLVQTVVPLPQEAQLKMTTSRYYTPSGRSIQRVDYTAKRSPSPRRSDTVIFATRNGRPVREVSGIAPDTTVSDSILPSMVQHLVDANILFRFATTVTSQLDRLPPGYSTDKALVESFFAFAERQPSARRSPVLHELELSRRRAESEGWPPSVLRSIEQAERSAEREFARTLRVHTDLLREMLDQEIRGRFADDKQRYAMSLRMDPCLRAAVKVLTSRRYAGFLDAPTTGDQ